MAALETIRTKFGIGASLIIAFGLLLFLVNPSDIIQTIQSASSKYDVGKINGKSVSYQDFDQEVKRLSDVREMITGTSASNEQTQRQNREIAWQNLVQDYLVIPTIKKAGINVGQQEEVDMFVGENVSPVISSLRFFRDENGVFSADLVRNFLEQMSQDESGRYVELRNYLQNTVRSSRYMEKYGTLLSAASYVNSLQTKKAMEENNTTASVNMVMSPNRYYPIDSAIVVSSAEIKKFYNDHKDLYKQNASRDIEYAVFEVVPSAADVAAQNQEFVTRYDEFAATESMRSFLQQNSDRQWSDNWVKSGELATVNRDIDAFVSANKAGTSPVIAAGNTFFAARIMESAMIPDSVYVRHILLQGDNARKVADSLVTVLGKRGNFAALAAQYSLDQQDAMDGELGNLGWMTQTAIIPGFESVITAAVGKPFVLNTMYGTHVVEVTKTTKPVEKKKVAIYEKATIPSKETYSATYNKANQLAVRAAGKLDNYKKVCDTTGIYSRALTINEGTDTYGAISHAKEVTRWAFDNKPGKASGIITVDNNYFFVVAVKGAHKEGYASVNEVAEGIRSQLYREKFAKARKADVAAQIEGLTSLDAIAEKLGASVSSLTDVTFSTNSAPATEPAFVGAVAAAKEGEIVGPVAGTMGTYVLQVTGRETGAYYTEDDAKAAQARMDQYQQQMLLPVMAEKTVKDNRARFY